MQSAEKSASRRRRNIRDGLEDDARMVVVKLVELDTGVVLTKGERLVHSKDTKEDFDSSEIELLERR